MRSAKIIFAALAVLLSMAACTGPSSSGATDPSSTPAATHPASAVAYSACMRAHGVQRYPDPDAGGNLPKGAAADYGVSDAVFQTAQRACRQLLPTSTGSFQARVRQCYLAGVCPADLVHQMMTVGQRFAQCMRSHGVSNWPDPTIGRDGAPYFDLSAHGWTRAQSHSPAILAKGRTCGQIAGGGLATG